MRDLGTGVVKGVVKMAELKVEEENSVGGLYELTALVKVMIENWQYKRTVKMPREQCRPPLDYLQIQLLQLFPDHEWAPNEKDRDRRKQTRRREQD